MDTWKIRGELNGRCVLTDRDVELVRAIYGSHDENGKRFGYRRTAVIFGVTPGTIRDIIKGRTRL